MSFFEIFFFFGGGPFLNSAFKGVVADQNWKLPMTDLGANQFLARLRHFQTPLKRRTLSLMFLGIAKTVEHTKEKTSGVRRNVGSFLVWNWKLEDFWTSKTFILVVSRLYFSFLLPWFVPKVAMCFVAIISVVPERLRRLFFFFESRWSERAFGWMFTSWCQDMSPTTWWHVWKQLKISWKGKEENQGVDFPEKLTFCFWLAWKSAPKRFVFLTFEDVVFENGVKLRSQWLMIWNPQYTSREAEKMLFLTTWKLFNFGKTHQHECI